jgi:hypothetical protein
VDRSRAIKIGKIAGAGGRFERFWAMVVQDCHAMDVSDPDAVCQRSGRMGLKINCGRSAAGCRVAGRGHPRPAPFYEQEVVKAFCELTHEGVVRLLARSRKMA